MIGLRDCIFLLANCGGIAIALRTLYRSFHQLRPFKFLVWVPFSFQIFASLLDITNAGGFGLIDHFTVVAKLPGLTMEARLPVTLF